VKHKYEIFNGLNINALTNFSCHIELADFCIQPFIKVTIENTITMKCYFFLWFSGYSTMYVYSLNREERIKT